MLDNGVEVELPDRFNYKQCDSCDVEFIWGKTVKNGKAIPVYWNTIYEKWICHFADCPGASFHRKKE